MKSESRRRASISKSQSARRNSSERRRSISRHLSYMRPNRRLSSIGKEMSVKQANQSIHQWLQAEFLAKDSPFLVFLSRPSVADADLINALSAREPVDSIRQRIESCVAQLNRDRLVNKLIVDGMLAELGLLIDAGVSVGRPRRVGVVQFSHLDLAGAQYDLYPSDRAFDIVLLLAQHTPRATSLPALASLIRHVNLTADQIEALAMAIVSGNADGFLLTTILTLANVLQQSGVDVVSHRQRLQRTATRLTHVATGILVDMKSDRLVSIALEAKDDDGQSPIDVALQTNNVAFMSSDVVVRFMTRVWTSSRYLDQPVGTARLHHLVLWDPYSLFKSNVVRYGMRVLLYIAFAAFVSWSAVGRLSATDPIRWFEIVYWVAAIGFLIDNVQSANRTGWASFFMSGWHHTDALGCVVIVAIALFRAASRGSDGSLIAGQVAFNGLVSAIVLILWVGLAQQFVLIPPVGTLMRTFSMHARSLVTLVVVASAFVLGFSTALVATVGEGVPEFGTLQRSVLTLYRGALSMFSFVPFTQMRTGEPAVGQTAFAIYLLIMTVIVCRTLVVVGMKSTIASMRATALSGFRFDFGKTCWDLHRRNAHLPPPLNLVVYLTYPAVALVLCTRQQWTGRQSHDKGADLWICYHCHHCNPALDEAHAEAELKKWIKDVEGNVSGALECLPARSAEQCRRCSMLKRTIAPADLTLERISLFYFIVLVWVPTAIVLVIPFGLWQALSRRRARVSKSRAPIASPGAFVKTRSPAEQDLDNARRAWVEGVHRKLQSQRYPSRGA